MINLLFEADSLVNNTPNNIHNIKLYYHLNIVNELSRSRAMLAVFLSPFSTIPLRRDDKSSSSTHISLCSTKRYGSPALISLTFNPHSHTTHTASLRVLFAHTTECTNAHENQ